MGRMESLQFSMGNTLHQHLGAKFNCASVNRLVIEQWTIGLDLVRNQAADKSATELNPSEKKE